MKLRSKVSAQYAISNAATLTHAIPILFTWSARIH